jgi:hypothetical protein
MSEHIAHMGPMLVLAGLVLDRVLGTIGSVIGGSTVWVVLSSEAGMLAMSLIGCGSAALALVAPRRFWRYARPGRPNVVRALALVLLVSLVASRTADGEVAATPDFAACNAEALDAVRAGTAAPTMDDHVRADLARSGARATNAMDVTGNVIDSSDPQIHGMEAEGAKDAMYQAAYRSCMRRKGF